MVKDQVPLKLTPRAEIFRWDEILAGLTPYIKQVGYNIERDVAFIPISGLKGTNIKDRLSPEVCPWYT
jgi:peptide chain release factor subunit 3